MSAGHVADLVRASRLAQGLPETVTDPAVLARVAALLKPVAAVAHTPIRRKSPSMSDDDAPVASGGVLLNRSFACEVNHADITRSEPCP